MHIYKHIMVYFTEIWHSNQKFHVVSSFIIRILLEFDDTDKYFGMTITKTNIS